MPPTVYFSIKDGLRGRLSLYPPFFSSLVPETQTTSFKRLLSSPRPLFDEEDGGTQPGEEIHFLCHDLPTIPFWAALSSGLRALAPAHFLFVTCIFIVLFLLPTFEPMISNTARPTSLIKHEHNYLSDLSLHPYFLVLQNRVAFPDSLIRDILQLFSSSFTFQRQST